MLRNRIRVQALMMLLIMFAATAVVAAEETTNWSTVKSQYRSEAGAGLQSVNKPVFQDSEGRYPTISPAKPSRFALQLPNDQWVSITELLNLLHDNTPDHPFWTNSGYPEWRERDFQDVATVGISDRWGFGQFWKWIQDHVKFTITGFGINFQLVGSGLNDCIFMNWNWFDNSLEFGPC